MSATGESQEEFHERECFQYVGLTQIRKKEVPQQATRAESTVLTEIISYRIQLFSSANVKPLLFSMKNTSLRRGLC